MTPRLLLRLEGLFVLLCAVAAYGISGFSWWLFAGLLLAPDLFMVGYLAGPGIGANLYNAGHTYTSALALGAIGHALAAPLGAALALIWIAHIGMDRALGYGLKEPTGFADTHLRSREASLPSAQEAEPSSHSRRGRSGIPIGRP